MTRQTRTMLMPGLGPEHVDSVVAIRALKVRSAVGLHRLADVATTAIIERRDAQTALIEESHKRIAAIQQGRLGVLEQERAAALAARDNARAWVAASASVADYLADKMIETREGLSALQGTVSNFVRGFLPSGSHPSWRRGALQGLTPYIVDAPKFPLGPKSPRGVWA